MQDASPKFELYIWIVYLFFLFLFQCIPTPLAWYAHQLPKWFQKLSIVLTWVVSGYNNIVSLYITSQYYCFPIILYLVPFLYSLSLTHQRSVTSCFVDHMLTLYTLTSVSIFCILFSICIFWYWQGEFTWRSQLLSLAIISFIFMILINSSAVFQ